MTVWSRRKRNFRNVLAKKTFSYPTSCHLRLVSRQCNWTGKLHSHNWGTMWGWQCGSFCRQWSKVLIRQCYTLAFRNWSRKHRKRKERKKKRKKKALAVEKLYRFHFKGNLIDFTRIFFMRANHFWRRDFLHQHAVTPPPVKRNKQLELLCVSLAHLHAASIVTETLTTPFNWGCVCFSDSLTDTCHSWEASWETNWLTVLL